MLMVWLDLLEEVYQEEIHRLDPKALYWPRSWVGQGDLRASLATDWYISWHFTSSGLLYAVKYPQQVRIVYRD